MTSRYGPDHDGVLDPDRMSIAGRQRMSVDRHRERVSRRRSLSPVVRALQAAADRALGGR